LPWPFALKLESHLCADRNRRRGPYKGQETDRGKLWRSDDGGENWRLVNYDRSLGGRTHYYFRVAVSPDNETKLTFSRLPITFRLMAARQPARAPALAAARVATITISGSIRLIRIAWPSRRFRCQSFGYARSHLAKNPISKRTDVSRHDRQSRPLLRFMATDRMAHPIGARVATGAGGFGGGGGGFGGGVIRAAHGSESPAARVAGPHPTRSTTASSVERVGLWQHRRHVERFDLKNRPGAQRRSLARSSQRIDGRGSQVSFRLDGAVDNLAARSQTRSMSAASSSIRRLTAGIAGKSSVGSNFE